MNIPIEYHDEAKKTRPLVAIISKGYTPYWSHFFSRIAGEIPQIRLVTIYTHDHVMAKWSIKIPREVPVVRFGVGEDATDTTRPSRILHEGSKGGRIIKWLADNQVSAVIQIGYDDAGRLRVIRWSKRNGIPIFIFGDSNIRGDRASGVKAKIKGYLLPRILKGCTGAMPCGRLGKAYFEKYGLTAEQIFLVPNEPDYRLIQTLSADRVAETRDRFGLGADRRRIVFSGRLVPIKRVDLLVDAFARIAGTRPQWDLVIIGDGPLGEQLRQQIGNGLKDRVIWTGFIDDQETVGAIYRACDVLVLPSDYEPWALVINEAAAANLAIICSDVVGAAPELVHDGVNGWTFPPGDLATLTTRLLEVTDPAQIDRMKSASAGVLQAWREKADPVEGVRRALRYCGLLSE
jgi:glycosyltransferase involved in cell wall biosynthesis